MVKILKKFIVRKYVWASSAQEAIKNEPKVRVDDVWVDDDWKKLNTDKPSEIMGFKK